MTSKRPREFGEFLATDLQAAGDAISQHEIEKRTKYIK
jgi:hypothetical protein